MGDSHHAPVVLAADPPWRFGDKLPGKGRGAAKHYHCLSVEQIARFGLPLQVATAQNAVLFMWRVSAMQEEAFLVAKAWGFRTHSELVWEKLTSGGKQHFGMGRLVRGAHESCLIAVRGRVTPAVRNIRSIFAAPVGHHSEKPDRFYELVEAMFPHSPRYELFARRVRPGWAQGGKELGRLVVREDGKPAELVRLPTRPRAVPRDKSGIAI